MGTIFIDIRETNQEKILKKMALYFTGLFFCLAGAHHFIAPEFYKPMMPPYIPIPMELIYISGFFEIIGGIGLMIPKTRVIASWGLMALLLAVLPADIHFWTKINPLPNAYVSLSWVLFLRIPLQFLFIAWLYMFAKNPQNY
jgi:uncharacterized membrane protein